MPIFIFLVGVRGSGKTTLINNYRDLYHSIPVLKPSTTRERRGNSDNEYHFVSEWSKEDYMWTISVGPNKYGVSKSEISQIPNHEPCLCVFDPGAIEIIKTLREKYPGRVVTVGIDTILSVNSQWKRVGRDESRSMSTEDFMTQRKTVTNCDVVLSGDEDTLLNGLSAVIDCISGKGGVLVERQIVPLIKANALLEGAEQMASTASYDLRLGDDVWCQGKFITLSKDNPTLKIPPYSYAIVSCKEMAKLPSFVSARFDLKNSLFFRGVILSNGPQVDPGYHGALFCMLYNGSDTDVGITREKQFSTIEFHRTCGLSHGYSDKYQRKFKLSDFIPPDVAVSKGGMILERTQEKIEQVEKQWKKYKSFIIILIPIIITILTFLIPFIKSQYEESVHGVELKRNELERKISSLESLETKVNLLIEINKPSSINFENMSPSTQNSSDNSTP